MIEEKIDIKHIPALVCFDRNAEAMPLLIFSHYFTGKKEAMFDEMRTYAANGFYTVSTDNWGHGERRGPSFQQYAMEEGGINILKVRELINKTAEEIPLVIDQFSKNAHADIKRVGMYGVSMGGFITYRALTIEDRIRAAAPFISSPEWDEFPKIAPLVDTPEIRRKLKEYSKSFGPLNLIEKFYDKNLLIQIGKEDNHFDVQKVEAFVENVKRHSTKNIEFIEYDNVAHQVTEEMRKKAFIWFKTVLCPGRGHRTMPVTRRLSGRANRAVLIIFHMDALAGC